MISEEIDVARVVRDNLKRFKRDNTWTGEHIRHNRSLHGKRLFDCITPLRMISKDFEPLEASSSFDIIRRGFMRDKPNHQSRIIGIRL